MKDGANGRENGGKQGRKKEVRRDREGLEGRRDLSGREEEWDDEKLQ